MYNVKVEFKDAMSELYTIAGAKGQSLDVKALGGRAYIVYGCTWEDYENLKAVAYKCWLL